MFSVYKKRTAQVQERGRLNKDKLERAKLLEGKFVRIGTASCKVVGYSETTGDSEVRVGTKVKLFDPMSLTVVD